MEYSNLSVFAGPGRSNGASKLPPDYSRLGELGHRYDPDQPRVPAGHPEGGQWTRGWQGSNLTSSRANSRAASAAPAVPTPPSADVPITYPTATQRMSDFGLGIAKGIAQNVADLLWHGGAFSACEADVSNCIAMLNDGPPQLFGPPSSIAEAQGRMVGPLMLMGLPGPRGTRGNAIAETASPTGKFYSVAYEMTLNPTSYPGASRAAHFREANEELLQTMERHAGFAQDMQHLGISLQRTPDGLTPRTSPSGWSWHHAEEPGVMQLVPRSQHQPGSIFQDVLHPRGIGGYSTWGK